MLRENEKRWALDRPSRRSRLVWLVGFLAALMMLAAACGDDKKKARSSASTAAKAKAKKATSVENDLKLPTESAVADSFIYTPVGKRDPFKSAYKIVKTPGQNPDEVVTSPLQQFEIDQLKLIAVVSGISQPRAMVEAPDGKGYTVKIGTRIGKHFGRVVKIKSSELIIAEDYRDWNGRKVTNYIHVAIKKDKKK